MRPRLGMIGGNVSCQTPSYKQIGAALIPATTPGVYIRFVSNHAKAAPSMEDGGHARRWRWRRLIVDALISASTVAVAFSAIGATADGRYILLILGACALVGIGLILEPNVTAQLAYDGAPAPLRPPRGPNLRDPGKRQSGEGFDATIMDVMST